LISLHNAVDGEQAQEASLVATSLCTNDIDFGFYPRFWDGGRTVDISSVNTIASGDNDVPVGDEYHRSGTFDCHDVAGAR
jgi:hypothetical protein